LLSFGSKNKAGLVSNLTGLYQQMVEQLLKWKSKDPLLSAELLLVLGKIAEARALEGSV